MESKIDFARGVLFATLLAVLATFLARLPSLAAIGPLTLALLFGLAASAARRGFTGSGVPSSESDGITFAAKTLLRIGVVLVGVRLDFGLLARAGARILLLDLAIVAIGLVLLFGLGRRLGLPSPLAALLAVGTSICGASAVVAARDATGSDDDDVAVGVALCGIVGTSGVLAYLALRPLLELDGALYGTFAGATLHEVAQVFAAATPVPGALSAATVTKLTRVAILPVVILAIALARHRRRGTSWRDAKTPLIPGFVVGFVVVGIVNSLASGRIPAPALADARKFALLLSLSLMTIAMAAAGLQLDWERVRRVGWPAVATMAFGFVLLAGIGFGLVQLGLTAE